jgi:hypothetical protein
MGKLDRFHYLTPRKTSRGSFFIHDRTKDFIQKKIIY